MKNTDTVAVIGAGIMGRGIARVFASAGYLVHLLDKDSDTLEYGMSVLHSDIERSFLRGDITNIEREETLARVTPFTRLEEAVGVATVVIEAAPEDLHLKQRLFRDIERSAPQVALLATNTSALSVTAIASAVSKPGRVVGLHFFNPVHRMPLVEIVRGIATDPLSIDRSDQLCRSLGKTAIHVVDRAGFATSRINAMIGNEAFYMLMEGVASAEDIDVAMKLGLNHPMGPFELIDLVGLDTRLSVLERLHKSLGEKFRPCPLLVSLVEAGRLGRKTGHGVYRYDESGVRLEESAVIAG